MELIIIHLLTHEIPIVLVTVFSLLFGKRALFKYIRKHDPLVQELREASKLILKNSTPHAMNRLAVAIEAIEECSHSHHEDK